MLYYEKQALVTNIAGDVTELDWSITGEVDERSFCSLTFHNEMYIYGQVLRSEYVLSSTEIAKTNSNLS